MFFLKELSFLMLGTGVEDFSKQMENSTYPIQWYFKPHFEMLKKLSTPIILPLLSFDLDLKLKSGKTQCRYEGNRSGKDRGTKEAENKWQKNLTA